MAGRSNVGKSSLINAILNRKKVARVSQTPGKTQAVQFYLINEKLFLVDLPGYGYAKVPKTVKRTWGQLVESYIESSEALKSACNSSRADMSEASTPSKRFVYSSTAESPRDCTSARMPVTRSSIA